MRIAPLVLIFLCLPYGPVAADESRFVDLKRLAIGFQKLTEADDLRFTKPIQSKKLIAEGKSILQSELRPGRIVKATVSCPFGKTGGTGFTISCVRSVPSQASVVPSFASVSIAFDPGSMIPLTPMSLAEQFERVESIGTDDGHFLGASFVRNEKGDFLGAFEIVAIKGYGAYSDYSGLTIYGRLTEVESK